VREATLRDRIEQVADIYSERRSDVSEMLRNVLGGQDPSENDAEHRYALQELSDGTAIEYDTLTTLFRFRDKDGVWQDDFMNGTTYHESPNKQRDADEISVTWSVHDVLSIRPRLTQPQAMEVLSKLEQNHDASVGINWDVIRDTADIMFEKGDEKECLDCGDYIEDDDEDFCSERCREDYATGDKNDSDEDDEDMEPEDGDDSEALYGRDI
jgi:hypothetical protein